MPPLNLQKYVIGLKKQIFQRKLTKSVLSVGQVNIQLWPKISSSINIRRWTHLAVHDLMWIASQNEKVGRFLDICISYNSPKCWSEQVSAIQDGLGVNEEPNRETNSTRNTEQFLI